MPAIGGSSTAGKFLQNVGFYWAVNDYLGLKLQSNVYFNGGYNGSGELEYKVNYKH